MLAKFAKAIPIQGSKLLYIQRPAVPHRMSDRERREKQSKEREAKLLRQIRRNKLVNATTEPAKAEISEAPVASTVVTEPPNNNTTTKPDSLVETEKPLTAKERRALARKVAADARKSNGNISTEASGVSEVRPSDHQGQSEP